ncbi:unnamed protein product [Somion occarium]|uniref:Ricin B lectin domain-containing protein n=1 Tax=Somion occarium TaxID=3059160 RepID=A0ABP1D7T3_9APHY
MSIEEGHKYRLVNAKSGTTLDLSGGDNKSLIGYDWHGGENQKWILERQGSGWTFKNAASGLYFSVEGNAEDGSPVTASENPTQWDIWPDEEDGSVYRIFLPNTRFNIDLADHGNPTPGTLVTLWNKWHPGVNQCWRFEQAD